jgi:hypothetical protein
VIPEDTEGGANGVQLAEEFVGKLDEFGGEVKFIVENIAGDTDDGLMKNILAEVANLGVELVEDTAVFVMSFNGSYMNITKVNNILDRIIAIPGESIREAELGEQRQRRHFESSLLVCMILD